MKKIMLLFLVILFMIPFSSARADAAPPPAPGYGGITPFHYQSTEVQMVYERVEMDLQRIPNSDDPTILTNQVSVTARFVMHNTGKVEEKMQVVFPLESLNECLDSNYEVGGPEAGYYRIVDGSFNVDVNGVPTPSVPVTTESPDEGESQYCENATMNWAGFDVEFPIDKDVLIQVNYTMNNPSYDSLQALEYVLETGAAWKGPIGEAYIVMHFPYIASPDNIGPGTTPGYQFLYDEIYWSYENIKPTRNNNIFISFISPDVWQNMEELQSDVQIAPHDVDAWLSLANLYNGIGYTYTGDDPEGDITTSYKSEDRYDLYVGKHDDTFQQAMAANPDSPDLPARWAALIWYGGPVVFTQDPGLENYLLSYLNRALALDPQNKIADDVLSQIEANFSDFTFTPPATIPPTIMLPPSATPLLAITGTPAITFTPTSTPSFTITSTPTITEASTIMPTFTKTELPTLPPSVSITAVVPMPAPIHISQNSSKAGWERNVGWYIALVILLLILVSILVWRSTRHKKI
ncbi:MAG: hypothetical protein WCE68_18980 [Anaerolineales bacterium]